MIFLTPKEPFMATFSEKHQLSWRNKVAEQVMRFSKSPRMTFGGHFQRDACTPFQEYIVE